MTPDRLTRAISAATRDIRHASAMLALAQSDAAKARHARRVDQGRKRLESARRDLMNLSRVFEG